MNPEIYSQEILVKPEHIDNMQHVNNVVYLQWVQDVAYAHWTTKAPTNIQEQYKWVVLKHEIEYKSAALLGEELIAKTWVRDYAGVKSTRVVQILKKSNNRLLAEANSLWCLISSTNNRPARIPDDIKSVFVPEQSESEN
jgi:acyl-CoA thioester hydrolase